MRKINILQDLLVLIKLFNILIKERVDLIITITPKAGLLGCIAGFFLSIKKSESKTWNIACDTNKSHRAT